MRCKSIFIGAGDPLRIPTPNPNNDSYALSNNKFFTDELFDGNTLILNDFKERGRCDDDTPDLFKTICEPHRLTHMLKDKESNINHWRHFTLTNTKRNYLHKS